RVHMGFNHRVEFSEHHRSHAASAFFTSPFERAVVVTLDGVGEYETASVHLGEGNRLTKLRSIHFPHSLGLFYSVFTQYLGFEVNEGEYKVMGLAPYGRPRYRDKLLGPILKLGIRSHIHPAAGDAGGALGAALQWTMRSHEHEAARRYSLDAYLGVDYPEPVIKATLSLNNIPFRECADIAEELATALAAGKVVAILHGRDEWGPRSLGARSILADPRRAEMKDHLNAKIKFREEFRPFAPVVKKEAYGEWFETLGMAESPFMLYTHKALRPDQTAAVTHVDGTSRVQTVSAEQNPYLYRVLDAFERRTGVPVLINTSFNLRSEERR